ncbi:MAG: hypothetical protein N838_06450 [Thiohalocapsa sp. PB-PSB1]|nr:MAG: hypothetical protein N838_06450 [Thiohalocapsa sp. PB-PSB1]
MSEFDSDSDPDTDSASPVRSMKQSKTRNRFGIKTQDISTAYLQPFTQERRGVRIRSAGISCHVARKRASLR